MYDCDEAEDVGMSGGILMGATDSACEIMTGFEATPMTPTTDACIYPPSGDDVANFVDDPYLKYSSEYVCASSWEYGSNFYDEDWYNGGCAGTLSGCSSECTIGSYPWCEAVDSSTGAYTGGWCYCEYAPTASPTPSTTESSTTESSTTLFVKGSSSMNYNDARQWCMDQGYALATIYSAEENEVARGLCGDDGCWIDLVEVGGDASTLKDNQHWQWADGSSASYLNFAEGEPNNLDGCCQLHDQRNAIMNYNGRGEWYDEDESQDEGRALCRTNVVSGAAATSVARFAFVIVLGLVATHARAYLV